MSSRGEKTARMVARIFKDEFHGNQAGHVLESGGERWYSSAAVNWSRKAALFQRKSPTREEAKCES